MTQQSSNRNYDRNIDSLKANSRRKFLRGVGTLMSLPLLESIRPACSRAATGSELDRAKPRRMLGICNNLSLLPDNFFPKQAGRDYELSPYLKLLESHRDDFTVFTGVSHPDVDGGHPADVCFLSAAPHPNSSGFRNSISIDQYMAERVGHLTRFPSLTLGVNAKPGLTSLSFTASGALMPCENNASDVFRQMFIQGTPSEVATQMQRLDEGQSIMDAVAGQAKDLQRKVTARDRNRLDQYFTSVRELEQRLQMSRRWGNSPLPVVNHPIPVDPASPKEYMDKVKLMYDMARLAFETDSTRCISLMLDGLHSPAIEFGDTKFTDSYHLTSHHGKKEGKLKFLKAADEEHMKLLAGLYSDLKAVEEDGEPLLDRTMVLYGSNMNSANSHATTNLPILFAGGGFKHGQHLVFDKDRNYPLPNLFVSMLQRMGIESDRFSTSTGTMRGLELS